MAEISNNLLAGLLIVAILVSIVGLANTFTMIQYPVTGFAGSGTGKANLTVVAAVSITLLRNESLFGSGYNYEAQALTLRTNNSNQEGNRGTTDGWFNNGSEGNMSGGNCTYGKSGYDNTSCANPFVVKNDGNDDTTCIKVYAAQTADTWIGGVIDTPSFKAMATHNESAWGGTEPECTAPAYAAACTTGLQSGWSAEMTTTSPSALTMCQELNSSTCSDELRIHFKLEIPRDTVFGGKQTTVTVTGADNC